MLIDFHHPITYITARIADFTHEEAAIIAYSAQYVDDAVYNNVIHFDSGALYMPIGSAHKTLDYRNFSDLANHFVWIPFHFLPGNDGEITSENHIATFCDKIVCTPNSIIAHDVISDCMAHHDKPYALYRLGITMHVLVWCVINSFTFNYEQGILYV